VNAGPWLWQRAQAAAGAPAVETDSRHVTFAELAAGADQVARRLAGCGVRAGERVAVVADPCLRTIEIVHAVSRLGAVLVPIGTRLTAAEVAQLVAFVRPALVVHDGRHGDRVPADSIDMHDGLDAASLAPADVLHDVLDPDDLHSIVFTSGTTATPKGAMLTHGAHLASALGSAARLGTTSRDRWLVCMPLTHVGGLAIVLRSVITGFALVVQERFDPARVNGAIANQGITTVSVVATMLARMLEELGERGYPATLRCVLLGGGPLPPGLLAQATEQRVPIVPTYGLTEACSQVATAMPGAPITGAHAAGRPLAGVEVRIGSPRPDGVGEILVRGATLMRGYLDDEAATHAALARGWLHTGDLGRLSPGGELTVEGRLSDVIVTGGENVVPDEVEAILRMHPVIADAAVYGVPDEYWGERVLAALVVRGDDLDEPALREWCRGRLAGFKVPAAFRRVAALPRTASGKLLRRALLSEAAQ